MRNLPKSTGCKISQLVKLQVPLPYRSFKHQSATSTSQNGEQVGIDEARAAAAHGGAGILTATMKAARWLLAVALLRRAAAASSAARHGNSAYSYSACEHSSDCPDLFFCATECFTGFCDADSSICQVCALGWCDHSQSHAGAPALHRVRGLSALSLSWIAVGRGRHA